MPSWNSRGLRGSVLEEMLNVTNEKYRQEKLALVQKIPTPITPMEIDREKHHITLAYFEQKSTVDYIGNVQGVPVCFDAKECATDTFPLQNIHEHQMKFMSEFEQQQGIAFLIIYFSSADEYYYVPYKDVSFFWDRAEKGGRKSFRREELDMSYRIRFSNQTYIHYLEMLSKDLQSREE
ncbi:MAG: Holliday junction resolvase RecU [Butyribacter sp.]|nr:Holliday junction resolvase RecU [bacterium]MDY3853776.1 Holliday junction resolvase RecU [Butyribacter sp.]